MSSQDLSSESYEISTLFIVREDYQQQKYSKPMAMDESSTYVVDERAVAVEAAPDSCSGTPVSVVFVAATQSRETAGSLKLARETPSFVQKSEIIGVAALFHSLAAASSPS